MKSLKHYRDYGFGDHDIRFLPKFLFFNLLIFVICGCQPTERNLSIPIIEVDATSNAELKLSEYFEDFRMLKLPTDTVMGVIQKIKYENNRIYISDRQTLFIFSEDGDLLSYFQKRGRGPGEYSGITDFMVDGETITVLDRNQQRLLTYDHSGKSISTRNLGYFGLAISPAVDNSFFLYLGNSTSHKLRRIRNEQEDFVSLAVDENLAKFLLVFAAQNFQKYQASIYFTEPINDTIYKSINGGEIKPSFYIDFKGKNIPASFLKRPFEDVQAFSSELRKTPYAYGVYNFAVFDQFIMFGSRYLQNTNLTVFDYKNKISNTFAAIKDDVYFNGLAIPVSEFGYHASNRIFVPLDAFAVSEWKKAYPPAEQFKEMVHATKEGDNPLLLIFNFKQ